MRWADIRGYEGLYQISDTGLVQSLPRLCVHPSGRTQRLKGGPRKLTNVNGYHAVNLSKDGKATMVYVHQLVAKAFLPNPLPAQIEVNHKDGIKDNNVYTNLEWATSAQNIQHACATGLRDDVGSANNNATLTESIVRSIHCAYAAGASPTSLARQHGVKVSAVYKIVNGRSWKHLGLPVIYRS